MQLTVKQVAALLSVSEKTIYRWLNEKRLPVHRMGGQYRFSQAEIVQWAATKRKNVSPDLLVEPEAPMTSLYDALHKGGIFYRVAGDDVKSTLEQVVKLMPIPEMTDRDFLLEVLLSRESMGSTGIGNGIAMPHARNPVIQHLVEPLVTLCFLDEPIDFKAIDGKPVDTLFTIISPSARAHLNIIAKLSYMLRETNFIKVIKEQASRKDILVAAKNGEKPLF